MFKPDFPESVYDFIDLTLIDGNPEEREESLKIMRQAMIQSQKFDAIVLIGGMEGVIDELEMFLEFHPNAQIIPLASTGAASRIVYESEKNKLNPRFELDPRFENDYTYSSLFRRLFHNHLKN
ncbi:SLOG domain-containing protein [Acinetobacter colistiniresistens]|uniref:SLOG domain-containing protein n=1 Tax=Acinetobacter colistiniresistens TaxID=280145 RepID=UPI0013A6BF8B|nr:hypothetical protein [Acinetobacter colistiniresistens]